MSNISITEISLALENENIIYEYFGDKGLLIDSFKKIDELVYDSSLSSFGNQLTILFNKR